MQIGPARLWANHELACQQFGITGAFPEPCAITRINRQIALVPPGEVSGRISWISQQMLTAPFGTYPGVYPEAPRAFAGYKATHGFGGKYIVPLSVSGSSIPSGQGPHLIDGVLGDPFNVSDPAWVDLGTGTVTITIDLGSVQSIDWVDLHCMHNEAAGIQIPQSLTISTSADGSSYTQHFTTPIAPQTNPYSTQVSYYPYNTTSLPNWDGEWAIGNATPYFPYYVPLGVTARYIQLTFNNTSGLTYVSEIEIVGS
jgi:hypothetical protein